MFSNSNIYFADHDVNQGLLTRFVYKYEARNETFVETLETLANLSIMTFEHPHDDEAFIETFETMADDEERKSTKNHRNVRAGTTSRP